MNLHLFKRKEWHSNSVFIYGSCSDTFNILKLSTIGVLASKSEGLPLALLEYGLANLPVVATNVGDCHRVISNINEGLLVESGKHEEFFSRTWNNWVWIIMQEMWTIMYSGQRETKLLLELSQADYECRPKL